MNNVNIDKFLKHEYKTSNEKQYVDKILILWLLNLILYFVGVNSVCTGIFVSVINIAISRFLLKLIHDVAVIEHKFLFNGIHRFYLSFMLIILSYKVLNEINLYIFFYYFLVVLIFSTVSWSVVLIVVNNGKYRYKCKERKNSLYPYVGALIGFLLARFMFENMELSQESSQKCASIILLILSIVINCNNLDLMKFVLIKMRKRKTGDDSPPSDEK